jgi:NADH-ubiquinone oxidoreductase chain 2
MCLDYFKEESLNAFESIVLILLSTRSMLLMISAYDLIAMYLVIELQSLCFYVIAALKRDSEFSTEENKKQKNEQPWNRAYTLVLQTMSSYKLFFFQNQLVFPPK